MNWRWLVPAGAVVCPMHALAEPSCSVRAAAILADRTFARYPALGPNSGVWRSLLTDAGEARKYRTVLRQSAKGPPNFAGHYTLTEIGCGAGVSCPAFVDRTTGRVRFDPLLRVVADAGWSGRDVARLTYRRNSRLLIAFGAPNERAERAGFNLFTMERGRLRLIRFMPERALCWDDAS